MQRSLLNNQISPQLIKAVIQWRINSDENDENEYDEWNDDWFENDYTASAFDEILGYSIRMSHDINI